MRNNPFLACLGRIKQRILLYRFFRSGLYRYWLSPIVEKTVFWYRSNFNPKAVPLIHVEDTVAFARKQGWTIDVRPRVIQSSKASLTTAENIQDLLRYGRQRVRESHMTRKHRKSWVGEMYFSHLLSYTRYPVDETFVCEIPHALVFGPSGFVVTPNCYLLLQASLNHARQILRHLPVVTQRELNQETHQGLYVSLLSHSWTSNYSHWLLDSAIRLAMLPPDRTDFFVIIPHNLPSYFREVVNLLGIEDNRIVHMPAKRGSMKVEKLLLCVSHNRATQVHSAYLHSLRDRMVQGVLGNNRHALPWRKIYVSRKKSTRKIVNESELLSVLAEFGFELVICEDLTVSEQVKLFAESKVVVGAHGAGMVNPIFCNPGAIVVEIYNRRYWSHCFSRVHDLLGHTHWHVFGDDVNGTWGTRVEPELLRKLLSYALLSIEVPPAIIHDQPY